MFELLMITKPYVFAFWVTGLIACFFTKQGMLYLAMSDIEKLIGRNK